jgi:hypothetical protein
MSHPIPQSATAKLPTPVGSVPTPWEGEPFDWLALVPLVAHPTKVAVIEALTWIGRPLSASLLREVFDREWSLSSVSYHVTTLADFGVLAKVGERPARGAMERFYFFTPDD